MRHDIKSIDKLSKIAVKLDQEYETVNRLHIKKKKRILKRAIMIEKKLIKVVGKMFPLRNEEEIKDSIRNMLTQLQERMLNRVGRIVQRKNMKLFNKSVA